MQTWCGMISLLVGSVFGPRQGKLLRGFAYAYLRCDGSRQGASHQRFRLRRVVAFEFFFDFVCRIRDGFAGG